MHLRWRTPAARVLANALAGHAKTATVAVNAANAAVQVVAGEIMTYHGATVRGHST